MQAKKSFFFFTKTSYDSEQGDKLPDIDASCSKKIKNLNTISLAYHWVRSTRSRESHKMGVAESTKISPTLAAHL